MFAKKILNIVEESMHFSLIACCKFLLLFFLLPSNSLAADAMLAWITEPDPGITQVNVQVMQDDVWQQGQNIYSSKEINFSPSIGSNTQGTALMVWSATSTIRSIVRSKFFLNGAWQSTEILSNQAGETTSPAVIFDRSDNATVVWVSDHQGLDDIYMREWNSVNKQWTETIKVNDDNEGPDISPNLSLDQHGNVVVRWSSFDESSLVYVEKVKVYEKSNSDSAIFDFSKRDLTSDDIKMPETFSSFTGNAVLHFPQNRQNRQIKIRD